MNLPEDKKSKVARSASVILAVSFLMLAMFTSCEVEFTPNAPWKEVPVVYCVLDQDDDTSWVRVERCFLSDGDMHDYGLVSDSINYPAGSIRVTLLAYNGGVCVDSLVCRDTLVDRHGGHFASAAQPMYYTTGKLNRNCRYKLDVTRVADGSTLATTDSIALIKYDAYDVPSDGIPVSPITKPTNTQGFGFFDRNGTKAVCSIVWREMENARLYQPVIRFYYGQDGDTNYIDLPCSTVARGNTSGSLRTEYSREAFLNALKSNLDTLPKQYLMKVDIFLTACTEDLNVYISSLNIAAEADQGREPYSNIRGGKGIFAARRTHVFKALPADDSMNPIGTPNPGLYAYLKTLNVGF